MNMGAGSLGDIARQQYSGLSGNHLNDALKQQGQGGSLLGMTVGQGQGQPVRVLEAVSGQLEHIHKEALSIEGRLVAFLQRTVGGTPDVDEKKGLNAVSKGICEEIGGRTSDLSCTLLRVNALLDRLEEIA